MAYYGQKVYPQELGNGGFTIAQAGCFLTAFCNMISRFGGNIDPPTLNAWFRDHGDYIKDPDDGSLEDLAWSSISQYDSNIRVTGTGNGPMPPSTPAIVKFIYRSIQSGQMITHFCFVDRIENGQLFIADSWDGLIKSPSGYESVYGKPVAWATYTDEAAAAAPSSVPAAPVSIPSDPNNTFDVVVEIPGYRTAGQAAARTGSNSTVPKGHYYVFNTASGMVNVTPKLGSPGWWVNPGDNVAPAAAPAGPAGYDVVKPIPGYMTANDAANNINSTVTVAPGSYSVFNQAHGMINVTQKPGVPGAWIDPDDNKIETPAPAYTGPPPMSDIKPPPAVTEAPTAPNVNVWKTTFQEHHDVYAALKDVVIHDLAGVKPDVMLHKYDIVHLAGHFTGPDGVLYGRTETSLKNGWWYGLPMSNLVIEEDIFNATSDTATRQALNNLKIRDKLVIAVAKVAGFIERFSKKKEPK